MPVPGTLKRLPINNQEISQLLEVKFGIEPSITTAYIHLVQQGDLAEEELARSLGMSQADTHTLLAQMVSQGLIIEKHGETPRFTALHPRMTMTNIFKVYEQELVRTLRDRRATVDRVVNLLTPVFEDRQPRRESARLSPSQSRHW